ncbi:MULTISPECIES: sodium:solute symporter [Serratia]|nr:sodium:solute symporter [Serratia marcescens]MDX7539587.1 sodium:solute symporter [Serratia marcescens]HBL7133420.1 sodium:solute symporter [Serratia marcescens]
MKKVFELIMFTLFFSSLAGIGVTAGFYCFVGTAALIGRAVW